MKQLLATLALAAWFGSSALAQDTVQYMDRTGKVPKETTTKGTIQVETPRIVVVKVATGNKEIPVADIIDIVYRVASGESDYSRARTAEKNSVDDSAKEDAAKTALGLAVTRYQEAIQLVTEPKAKRHLEYKAARLLARQAEDDPSKLDAAIEKLEKFKKDHSDGWQIVQCARSLARLQIAKKDYDGALKTYADLAGIATIAPEVKQDCDLQAAHVLVRAKKFGEAEKKLADLAKVPQDDRQKLRLQVTLAECQAEMNKLPEALAALNDVITKTTEADVRALAFNTRADVNRKSGRMEDALWDYLWVDLVYNKNRDEHAKAIFYLYKLFKDFKKNEINAQKYREKLEKQFSDTDYAKMLLTSS